ncbi:MAG TPA: ArsC/Spx/MgsR family protein [Gammaproteobacteria bacterium]
MPQIIFFEKPGCINNIRQKEWLRERGVKLEAIDLLTFPWSKEELLAFFGALPVSDWFNRSAPRVKSGELVPECQTQHEALRLLLQEPLLIRRPLLRKGDERRVGFDSEAITRWLGIRSEEQALIIDESCPRPARPCGTGEEKI